jgi:hypothetical protein
MASKADPASGRILRQQGANCDQGNSTETSERVHTIEDDWRLARDYTSIVKSCKL